MHMIAPKARWPGKQDQALEICSFKHNVESYITAAETCTPCIDCTCFHYTNCYQQFSYVLLCLTEHIHQYVSSCLCTNSVVRQPGALYEHLRRPQNRLQQPSEATLTPELRRLTAVQPQLAVGLTVCPKSCMCAAFALYMSMNCVHWVAATASPRILQHC